MSNRSLHTGLLLLSSVVLAIVCRTDAVATSRQQLRTKRSLEESNDHHPVPNFDRTPVDNTVVGGSKVSSGEFPFFVHFSDGSCGGSLISANRVLTAAHCLYGRNINQVVVSKSATMDGTCASVSCTHTHPDWNPSDPFVNDLAIIKLGNNVNNVPFVTINANTTAPEAGSAVQLIGFGQTTAGQGTGRGSMELQKVTYNSISDAKCKMAWQGFVQEGKHVCVADTSGTGACFGDSGGPLLDTTGTVQYGLVSGGDSCAQGGSPDVYTDVAFYASWIEEQKTSDKCDCPFPFSIFNGFRETVRSWVGDNWV